MKRKLCAMIAALMIFGSINVYAEDRAWEKEYDYVDSSENNTSNIGIKQNGDVREYYILDANGGYVSGSYLNEIDLTDDPDRFLLVDRDNDIMRIIDKNGTAVTGDYKYIRKIEGQRRYVISLRNNDLNEMMIIDENDTELLSERYNIISDVDGYIYLVKNYGNEEYKIGFADRNSLKMIVPAEFDDYLMTENNFYIYKKTDDANYDYYKLDNDSLSYYKSLPYSASVSNYFDGYQIGLRKATDKPNISEYGLADEELNVLIEPAYNEMVLFGDKITNTASDYAIVLADSTDFIEGKGWIKFNGKYGVIDKTGKRVIPCEYDEIKVYDANTFYCTKKDVGEYISVGEKNSVRNDIPVDNPSTWAQDEVHEAIRRGIVTEEFQCDYTKPITRKNFCELIINMLAEHNIDILSCADTNGIDFNDTDDPDIKLASALGIVAGVGNNKFNPDGKITRQEAARMLYQAATVSESFPEAEKYFDRRFIGSSRKINTPYQFDDISKFEYWASLGIQYCYQNEIMFGVGNNNFDPLGNYTREQAYLTVLRLDKKYYAQDIVSNAKYSYAAEKFIYGANKEEFDNVYTAYEDKTVVCTNGKYSLVDNDGNYIIDDISQNIELLNKPDTYVYDCFGDWLIIKEPLYSRTDGSVYGYRSSLCKANGGYLWTMPNLHFTDSGDVVCVDEANESYGGDGIKKALYTLFEREKYEQDGYMTENFLVYKK